MEEPFPRGGFSRHNLGVLLAVLGWAFLLATNVWPAGVFIGYQGDPPPWTVTLAIGAVYLAAPFAAQRSPALGKLMLAAGAGPPGVGHLRPGLLWDQRPGACLGGGLGAGSGRSRGGRYYWTGREG